jgi:hypothetical protein
LGVRTWNFHFENDAEKTMFVKKMTELIDKAMAKAYQKYSQLVDGKEKRAKEREGKGTRGREERREEEREEVGGFPLLFSPLFCFIFFRSLFSFPPFSFFLFLPFLSLFSLFLFL